MKLILYIYIYINLELEEFIEVRIHELVLPVNRKHHHLLPNKKKKPKRKRKRKRHQHQNLVFTSSHEKGISTRHLCFYRCCRVGRGGSRRSTRLRLKRQSKSNTATDKPSLSCINYRFTGQSLRTSCKTEKNRGQAEKFPPTIFIPLLDDHTTPELNPAVGFDWLLGWRP